MGPPRLGVERVGFRSFRAFGSAQPSKVSATAAEQAWNSLAFGSGEALASESDTDAMRQSFHDMQSHSGLGPDDSGEVLVKPDSSSGSAWKSMSGSSSTTKYPGWGNPSPTSAESRSALVTALGRFQIRSVLGQGEHATVYRAYDPILERDIALKVPRQGILKTPKVLDRFLGEAKALARLRHPGIVPVYEAGCVGGRHYIAMALIEGRSLAERQSEQPLTLQHTAGIVAELAEALAYAHTQGVVHRDVKPANIHVDNRGAGYLMDFGIAFRPDSGELPLPSGMILGTPAYVAPEQAQGGQTAVLPASDQYSLGVVLYELLCGQPPFCGPPSFVLFHTIHHVPPSPRALAPEVPRALAAICLKALAKSPDRRYGDCQHLADDLRRWLCGERPRAYRRGWRN